MIFHVRMLACCSDSRINFLFYYQHVYWHTCSVALELPRAIHQINQRNLTALLVYLKRFMLS